MNFLLASSGGASLAELLPNKIQGGEDIAPTLRRRVTLNFRCHGRERAIFDSDGNHVNVGNFDSKGLNVNRNGDDNRNDNLGLSSARQSLLHRTIAPTDLVGIIVSVLSLT